MLYDNIVLQAEAMKLSYICFMHINAENLLFTLQIDLSKVIIISTTVKPMTSWLYINDIWFQENPDIPVLYSYGTLQDQRFHNYKLLIFQDIVFNEYIMCNSFGIQKRC